jgi:hypothetical protein
MNEIDEHLQRALEALAGPEADVEGALHGVTPKIAHLRRRRRHVAVAVVGAAVVVGIAHLRRRFDRECARERRRSARAAPCAAIGDDHDDRRDLVVVGGDRQRARPHRGLVGVSDKSCRGRPVCAP